MAPYKLKILSGPLFGMDIRLPATEVFFVVGNHEQEHQAPQQASGANVAHVNSFAVDSLYLPLAYAAPNFTLTLTQVDADQEPALSATVLDEASPSHVLALPLNEPVLVGRVWIAVASIVDPWSTEVTKFTSPREPAPENAVEDARPQLSETDASVIVGELMPAATTSVLASGNRRVETMKVLLSRRSTVLFGIVLVGLMISAISARPFLAKEAGNALALAPTQATMVAGAKAFMGTDKRLYFITEDARQSAAVLRALASPSSPTTHAGAVVISREDLEIRIGKTLERHTVDFFKVRLHDVQNPSVLAEPQTTAGQDAANKELLTAFPFIRSLNFQSTSLGEVQSYAVRALQRAGASFDIANDDPLSFLVKMPASDYALAALRNQIKDFRSRWDTRHTTFGGIASDTHDQNWLVTKEGIGVRLSKGQTLWRFGAADTSKPSTTF